MRVRTGRRPYTKSGSDSWSTHLPVLSSSSPTSLLASLSHISTHSFRRSSTMIGVLSTVYGGLSVATISTMMLFVISLSAVLLLWHGGIAAAFTADELAVAHQNQRLFFIEMSVNETARMIQYYSGVKGAYYEFGMRGSTNLACAFLPPSAKLYAMDSNEEWVQRVAADPCIQKRVAEGTGGDPQGGMKSSTCGNTTPPPSLLTRTRRSISFWWMVGFASPVRCRVQCCFPMRLFSCMIVGRPTTTTGT
jgi:hypothetical protein